MERFCELEVACYARLTNLWNDTPTSVKKTSRFFPLRLAFEKSRTFSNVSQHAKHGSVLTLAKDRSSFLGLKSAFFCLASCAESQLTIAINRKSGACHRTTKGIRTISKLLSDLVRGALDPANSLVVEHDHFTANGDGAARKRKQRHCDVALPQVTDQVNLPQNRKRLHAWF